MADDDAGDADARVQVNITFRRGTLDELADVFPTALEDSERIRQAVAQSLERDRAAEFTIRRS